MSVMSRREITGSTIRFRTVGELQRALSELPSDLPIHIRVVWDDDEKDTIFGEQRCKMSLRREDFLLLVNTNEAPSYSTLVEKRIPTITLIID